MRTRQLEGLPKFASETPIQAANSADSFAILFGWDLQKHQVFCHSWLDVCYSHQNCLSFKLRF